MNPIKNPATQAVCVRIANTLRQDGTQAASDEFKQWLNENKGIVRWEVIAMQDQIRYLSKQPQESNTMSTTYTMVSAQASTAQNVLTMLSDARLIGPHKHTKLTEARQAILEVLPKLYAELNRMEKVTGKNMFRVSEAVTNMYGRASWVSHNDMMSLLEGTLEAFIGEYTEEAVQEAIIADGTNVEAIVEGVVYVSEQGTQWKVERPNRWNYPAVWLLTSRGEWTIAHGYTKSVLQNWLGAGTITKLK